MIFLSSGYLRALDQNSGREVWNYGLTVDNWNPLAYQNGVLYALNTPNGVAPPTINALAFHELPVPEMPMNLLASILATTLTGTILMRKTGSNGRSFRKREN